MHDHQSEVVSERVRDEKPVAAEILEPDLGLVDCSTINDGETAVYNFLVYFIGENVLARVKWLS